MNLGQVSIHPYTLSMYKHNQVDEDKGSELINGIPTKPSKLTKKRTNGLLRNI